MKRSIALFFYLMSIQCVLQAAVDPGGRMKRPIADTLLTIAGREVYIAFPESAKRATQVLFAFHGSGREARSYIPGDLKCSDFYSYQRAVALRCGYIFVVASFGRDIWGTDRAIEDFYTIYNNIVDTYKVERKWVAWASSAGGILLANVLKRNPGIIKKAIGTFPVYDLEDAYNRLASAREAWTDTAALKGLNPANFPDVYNHFPYLIYHGQSDVAVPIREHSFRFREDLRRIGWDIEVHQVKGGHSTNNWNVYDEKRLFRFLNYQ